MLREAENCFATRCWVDVIPAEWYLRALHEVVLAWGPERHLSGRGTQYGASGGEAWLVLFCFSVYTQDTGSPEKSYELELLTEQKKRGVSIYSCPQWAVYSNATVQLASGVFAIKVSDVKGDFHWRKRKSGG